MYKNKNAICTHCKEKLKLVRKILKIGKKIKYGEVPEMKVKVIDYGYEKLPLRAHDNDAGADVFAIGDYEIPSGQTIRIPLGLGLILPDGYAAYVFPRSGLASKGITCELPPIDSGYRGEIHAIVTNCSDKTYFVHDGDRIGQLVITPVAIVDFTTDDFKERGNNGFGSTGK